MTEVPSIITSTSCLSDKQENVHYMRDYSHTLDLATDAVYITDTVRGI